MNVPKSLSEQVSSATRLLAQPEVKLLGITQPLGEDATTVEQHIERAARLCYRTEGKMTASSSIRFLRGIILRGHESVLEHASATFRVLGGSRAYTHEQVRHRLLSFSQQSQRYVSEEDFRAVVPPEIAKDPEAMEAFVELVEHARRAYAQLKGLRLRNQDARFVLPNAVESGIVISGNFREWRHVIRTRCSPSAQWEIRRICGLMLRELQRHAPTVFGDLILDEKTWTVTHISETIGCKDAQQRVRKELAELEGRGEPPKRILRRLDDGELYRALFHVRRCLSPGCRKTFAACGDLK